MARTKREQLMWAYSEQVKWIKQCGGTRAGYVKHYGSKDDAKHYGDGGEAIYAADVGVLRRLEKLLGMRRGES